VRVVRYDRFDGIDELSVDDVPDPEPGAGQVVIRVEASCINPGSLSALHGAPYVPARDLAGTVVAVADDVAAGAGAGQADGVAIGDQVLGWVQDWAAHAELVALPAGQLVPKPEGLPWDVAGSLFVTPMAGLASVQAVAPTAGEVVVIAGASGGVGFTAAQLAQRRGATVVGIAGPARADRLRAHGIVPVGYGDGVADRVRAASGDRVDAFIDAAGAGSIDLALSMGVSPERITTVVDYRGAREKGVKALGTMDAGGTPALRGLAALAATGELVVPIASTYPLRQVRDAYRELAEGRPAGRVVLRPQR
jgi:NADPH:quinone reductase